MLPSRDKGLFEYHEKELFTLWVYPIVRNKNLTVADKQLKPAGRKEWATGKTYKIHAGYYRVLAGFILEIQFMEESNLRSHNCLFRATYLSMVLDEFAEELNRIQASSPWRFRSRALNPLLQRQLRGVHDDDALQVKMEVGQSAQEAAKFYLELDPLDPALINQVMRNILYVWPVRLALEYTGLESRPNDDSMKFAIWNTSELLEGRAETTDEQWESFFLMDYEIRIIQAEDLGDLYGPLLKVSELGFYFVSPPPHNRLVAGLSRTA